MGETKSNKVQLQEAIQEGKYQLASTIAIRCLLEEGKDKKLIQLNVWSKGAIKIEANKVKSIGEVQKVAGTFAMKDVSTEKPMKSSDIGGLIKTLSATYLRVRALEDAQKDTSKQSEGQA